MYEDFDDDFLGKFSNKQQDGWPRVNILSGNPYLLTNLKKNNKIFSNLETHPNSASTQLKRKDKSDTNASNSIHISSNFERKSVGINLNKGNDENIEK